MNVRRILMPIAILTVIAAACSTTTSESEGTIDEPFTRVVVTVGSGDVVVQRTTGSPEWFATADYTGARPSYEPVVAGTDLIVADDCETSSECSVTYTILVPEGTEVTATGGSGAITVKEITAAVSVANGSGTVFLDTVNGGISVTTGSGDIIGTKLVAAEATFDSASGSIDVAFENVIPALTIDTTSGDVKAQLAGGPYNLETETGAGNTDLKVDDDDNATNMVSLKTGSGDVTVYKQ